MNCVFVSGMTGGVGVSTVVANLAAALEAMNQRTLSIELDPGNVLGLHFGVNPLERDGWGRRFLNTGAVGDAVFKSHDGRRVLPFGLLNADSFSLLSEGLPSLLQFLQSPSLAKEVQWLLLDVPFALSRSLAPELQALKNMPHLDLAVTTTNPASYSQLKLNVVCQQLLTAKTALLLNRFEAELSQARDFLLSYQQEYPDNIVPLQIHRELALPEALANLSSVIEYAPFTRGAADFRSLAIWCLAELGENT